MVRLQPARGRIFLHPPIRSPSHYGSTATKPDRSPGKAPAHLHPTMVRLQLLKKHQRRVIKDASPSHYGSTATAYIINKLKSRGHISIPLWFDCNGVGVPGVLPGMPKSPSHYGSTATPTPPSGERWEVRISIPLWFDCNRRKGTRPGPGHGSSPSHYGSTATTKWFRR